ncbi:MAG: hypothetical protein CMJ46_03630 [Planctomyces sp.]|nr:hypothetical protein [Planctomyces sp.]
MIGSEYASPTDDDQYEQLPASLKMDETDINLRAYLSRLSDEHLKEYRPDWTDEQVMEWDGNFRSDGNLMLVCCERDIDVAEFKRVLEEHLQFRKIG